MAQVKKGVSYVLGNGSAKENHILPISAMQYSSLRRQLITGGRDGLVKVWTSSEPTHPPAATSLPHIGDGQYLDETLLQLETAISSNPLRHLSPQLSFSASSARNYNTHFDWINDLKLVNRDRHVVTALADLSLKLIDLDGDGGDVHKFQNFHTDYVKKLSAIAPQDLVVSGGLDGNIAVWDLQMLKPVQSFSNISASPNLPTSIYALSNDYANLISAGGPNNTINIYDRRISAHGTENLIRKLVGHQDNVRCLLMNSNFILSGSTDTTVKLWDLRNFKVYKNFDFHDDAVWSLSTTGSSCPSDSLSTPGDFKVFYSGDKSGNIIRTDLTYLSDHNTDNDGIFSSAGYNEADNTYIDERIGVSTLIAKTDSPIVSIGVEGETSVFASTYTSLQRYLVPNTAQLSAYQYLRTKYDYLTSLENQLDDDLSGGVKVSASDQSDLDTDFYDIVSHLSMDSTNLEILSSFSANKFNQFEIKVEETDGEYLSMFFTDDELPFNFVNVFKDMGQPSKEVEDTLESLTDETPVEISLNPILPSAIISIPFNRRPFQEFQLSPKSIIAKRMLNDKRRILALSLNGDITVWDLLICKEIKVYTHANGDKPLSKEEIKDRSEVLDSLFQEYKTMDTLNDWCEVEIKSGKLFVSLVNPLVSGVEIYYDELIKDYPFLAVDKSQNGDTSLAVSIDEKFPLCQIFLNSLFRNYSLYEWEADKQFRLDLESSKSKQRDDDSSSVVSSEDTARRLRPLFKRSLRSVPTQQSLKLSLSSATIHTINLVENSGSSTSSSSVLDDCISKLLLINKKRYVEVFNTHGAKKPIKTSLRLYTNDPRLRAAEQEENKYKPLIPLSMYPKDLLVIIVEKSHDLGNYRDVCSFHVGDLCDLKFVGSSGNQGKELLVDQLRTNLPKWVGQPILFDRYVHKEAPKLTFQLVEANYLQLPPDKKIGGRSQKKIKHLPMVLNSNKLVSQNMLRVNKILFYLTEKFESRTSEIKDKKRPEDWLVLECRGQELTGNLTLQTIKTKIWKSGGDIQLNYRRKFDA